MNEKKQINIHQDFAEFFGGLMPGLGKLKILAHIGSWITEMVALITIFNNNVSFLNKFWLTIFSVAAAILVSSIIELGVSRFVPFWTRQLVRLKFTNIWFVLMFLALGMVCIPLLVFSPTLSGLGGNEIVENFTAQEKKIVTDSLEKNFENRSDSINQIFNQRVLNLQNQNQKEIIAVEKKFESLTRAEQVEKKRYLAILANGSTWANGHIIKIDKKIENLQAQENSEIQSILSKYGNQIDKLENDRNNAMTVLQTALDRKINLIDQEVNRERKKRDEHINIWGKILMAIGIFCASGVFLIILIQEIYFAGSGKEYEKQDWNKKPGKLEIIWNLISGKTNDLFNKAIGLNGKPEIKPEFKSRPMGFQIQKKQDETLETKDFQPESKTRHFEQKFESEFVIEDVSKLITNTRNHYRRKVVAATETARQENHFKYQAAKAALERIGFNVDETSDTSLTISKQD